MEIRTTQIKKDPARSCRRTNGRIDSKRSFQNGYKVLQLANWVFNDSIASETVFLEQDIRLIRGLFLYYEIMTDRITSIEISEYAVCISSCMLRPDAYSEPNQNRDFLLLW